MRADLEHGWPKEREQAFVRDWNNGMAPDELRVKYRVRVPAHCASRLRQKGYVVGRRAFNDPTGRTL